MRNLPNHKAKIVLTIIIFTCILFYIEITAQQSNDLTSHLKQCWELTTDKMTLLGLASDNESKFTFYLPLLNGEIESINSTTGKKNWGSEFGGEIILPPFSDNKSVYILSKINTKTLLYSLSKELGITNWQTEFDFNDEFFLAEANNKLILLSRHGTLSVLNKDDGRLIWSRKLEQELLSTPILFEHQIILGTKNNKILFCSIENGVIVSQFDLLSSPSAIFIIKDRYLIWSDINGNAYLTSLATRKVIWKIRTGAEIINILVTEQWLLISSLDNFIYFASVEKGNIIWKKRLNGRPSINPLIVNNHAIITTFGSEFINIIDIENGKLVNQLFIGENNYFINKPILLDDLFIFPTVKGVVTFTNSKNGCTF